MTFDTQSFLRAQQTGANAIVSKPCPVGVFTGVITKSDIVSWQGKKDPSKSGLKFSCMVEIQDQVPGFERAPIVRYEIMLDLLKDGSLDMGDNSNVKLGKLRAACSMNDPSKPWSFEQFEGKLVRVSIKHRMDDQDATKVYGEVDAVFPAS